MISRVQFRRSLKKKLARTRITAPCLKVVGAEGEGGGWVYKDRLPIQEYSEEQTTMSSVCAALNPLIFFPQTSPCKSPASTGCCLSQFLFEGETGIFLPLVLTCHFNLKWTYPQKQMVDELPITALTSQLKGMSTWAKNCTAANLFSVLRWTNAPSSWRACCHGHCWRQPGEVLLGTDKGGLLWCCAMLHFWSNTMSSKVVLTFPLHMSLLQHRNQNEIRCQTVRYDIVTYLYTYTFWSC